MKTTRQCPKCKSLKVGYLEAIADHIDTARTQPQHLGAVAHKVNWAMSRVQPVGQLEAYVCAECGFLESYVQAASEVPFDKLPGWVWLNPDAPSNEPYR